MSWLTLPEVKAHLRIDHGIEDALIEQMAKAAEDAVARYLDRPVPWTDDEGEPVEVPAAVRQAALMLIGHWYVNRNTVLVGATSKEMELTTTNLLNLYRVGLGV